MVGNFIFAEMNIIGLDYDKFNMVFVRSAHNIMRGEELLRAHGEFPELK